MKAKKRQSGGQGGVLLRENFPKEAGRSRDIIGKRLWTSGRTLEKADARQKAALKQNANRPEKFPERERAANAIATECHRIATERVSTGADRVVQSGISVPKA